MKFIEVGNSYSRIAGLNPKEERELKTLLSYTIGGSSAYFSGYGIRKKSLLGKTGEFPSGLLGRVVDYTGPNIVCNDKRIRPYKDLAFPGIETYEWQRKASDIAIKAGRGTISAPTGTGKSRLIALIAARLDLRTLVVVPSLEIKRQLKDSLNADLGRSNKVDVDNIDSPILKSRKGYDCLIIDEAHHTASKTYQKLNKTAWNDIYYRFFLTATPFRNDAEETLLFESIAGRVIYKLDYHTAIKNNYIVPVEAYYIDLPKIDNDCYTYQEVYKKLVVDNDYRNNLTARLLHNLEGKSTLCLVKEVKHGRILSATSGLQFTNGEDEDSREYIRHFNNGTCDTLIATTGIMGEGVDSKPCEYVIIAGLGKAKSQFMQQVGRGLRNYPGKQSAKVIIFRDTSHKYLLSHFNAQKKILKEEYGVTPIKLDI